VLLCGCGNINGIFLLADSECSRRQSAFAPDQQVAAALRRQRVIPTHETLQVALVTLVTHFQTITNLELSASCGAHSLLTLSL
jgi:hypothetical protein